MKINITAGIVSALLPLLCIQASAQVDTAGIYGERRDSLNAAVFSATRAGAYLPRNNQVRTEVITAAGLCKMACCSLAESFENSASVTVGYSDAITGARQIRLLGQSGVYTQMLDENRPVMRGLAAPWGLTFIPGQWLESIQIAKGNTSVVNGVESMTGQINMEHRKPTDEKPLYVQASYMNDTKADLNVVSSLQLDEMSKWSTVILAHADGNFQTFDHNADGFMDDPEQRNFSLANRWLYFGEDGRQVRFGASVISDNRTGGQMDETGWRSDISNRSADAYVKVGIPINEDGSQNFAAVADLNSQTLDGDFGPRSYGASQSSGFFNLMYMDNSRDVHHYTLGLSGMLDRYGEFLSSTDPAGGALTTTARYTSLDEFGAFGEYTCHLGDSFSAIIGLRGEWYGNGTDSGEGGILVSRGSGVVIRRSGTPDTGFRLAPRLSVKWSPSEDVVVRANAGRGLRSSCPVTDNIGILSTGHTVSGCYMEHALEDSRTFGANATWYIPVEELGNTYISLDWFRTSFAEQMLYYNSGSAIEFYRLSSLSGGYSHTDNLQADFSTEPVPGFTVTLTGRWTDARQSIYTGLGTRQSDDVKPMASKYKAVLNMQYATHLNKWIFDFTASLNGPCRVWEFMRALDPIYADGYTPVYPTLYAQVTKRFKGFDIYLGGENLTGYTQPNPIISASDPSSAAFDASCIWGPLMGAKLYAGIRMTIWKTE